MPIVVLFKRPGGWCARVGSPLLGNGVGRAVDRSLNAPVCMFRSQVVDSDRG